MVEYALVVSAGMRFVRICRPRTVYGLCVSICAEAVETSAKLATMVITARRWMMRTIRLVVVFMTSSLDGPNVGQRRKWGQDVRTRQLWGLSSRACDVG